MNELQRQPNETCADWLRRLERIEVETLPHHLRRALELSISYARYRTGQGGRVRPETSLHDSSSRAQPSIN